MRVLVRSWAIVLSFALAVGSSSAARGQCTANEFDKLIASDGDSSDHFGYSAATSGNTSVIGATYDEGGGSAYVFNTDDWSEITKLVASDGQAGDRFASSVAIWGDTIVIGAYHDDNYTGSAYVFERDAGGVNNWGQVAHLTACDREAGDNFANRVAIWGDTIVMGAQFDDNENGTDAGSAYVFEKGTGWVDGCANQVAKLLACDGDDGDRFTGSGIWGDTIVMGALDDEDNGPYSGSAYVFEKGAGWVDGCANQVAKLLASDGESGDYLAYGSPAISGDTVLVGAGFDTNSNGVRAGSAYVFVRPTEGWDSVTSPVYEDAKLIACDGAAYDYFGLYSAISDDTAVLGADRHDGCADDSGAAYAFHKPPDGWGSVSSPICEDAKLLASDCAASDYFGGMGVAISDGTAVIGATYDDDHGPQSGSAYLFRGLSDCNVNETLDVCDIASGTSEDCNSNGIPDECDIAEGISQDCNSNAIPDECDILPPETTCCEAHPEPGCDSPSIEACVCAVDPYCCDTEWDRVCVDEVTSEGCGLCDNDCNTNSIPDDCEPDFDGDGLIDDCDGDIDDDGVPNEGDVCDYTPLGTAVDSEGRPLGDIDKDCDTDLADYALFQDGFTGPL